MDQVCMTLVVVQAKNFFFDKISTGAQNDLQQITRIAYAMVTVYGMNEKVGNVSFYDPQQENAFTKPYSEETSKIIDEEVRKLIDEAYERTKALLRERNPQVEKLAEALLEKEVLFQSDVEALIGKRPYEEKKSLEPDDTLAKFAEGVPRLMISDVIKQITALMNVSPSKENILKRSGRR